MDLQKETNQTQNVQTNEQQEPTIIFLFNLKNWYESISPLTKLDLIDIAPLVSTQFYIDYGVKAYVLVLTKGKWDSIEPNLKKKFMFISRTVKEQMEGPMSFIQKETYENSDIFELIMAQQSASTSNVQPESKTLESIKEDDDLAPSDISVPELI